MKVIERGFDVWKTIKITSRCMINTDAIRQLRSQRARLREDVMQLVDQYLPSEIDRMFYVNDTTSSRNSHKGVSPPTKGDQL